MKSYRESIILKSELGCSAFLNVTKQKVSYTQMNQFYISNLGINLALQ